MELEAGRAVGDAEDDLFDFVEVGEGVCWVGFFEVAAADPHPDARLLVVGNVPLARVERDGLEGLRAVREVLICFVGVGEDEFEVCVLLFVAHDARGEGVDDGGAGFEFDGVGGEVAVVVHEGGEEGAGVDDADGVGEDALDVGDEVGGEGGGGGWRGDEVLEGSVVVVGALLGVGG